MAEARKTNKRLVKFLMDIRGIETMTITDQSIAMTFKKEFTPEDGERLIKKIGHTQFKAVRLKDKNMMVISRW